VSHLARLALVLLVSTLTACGGKSSASPDDDGHAGSGTGGTGGKGTGGSTSTGGKGSAGNPGTGGANACTSFDDDSPTSVNVAISNLTSAPIYLGQDTMNCELSPLFEVADAAGVPLPSLPFCRNSCLGQRTGIGGCVALCPASAAVALQPNETMYTTWSGLFLVQEQLPAKCAEQDTGSEAKVSCDQAKRIEPGTFTFSARAGSSLVCSNPNPDGTCAACTPSASGGCATPGGLIDGARHTAQTTVVLNENYGVYPTPSASPGPNAGDAELPAPGGAVAVLTVELIFKE